MEEWSICEGPSKATAVPLPAPAPETGGQAVWPLTLENVTIQCWQHDGYAAALRSVLGRLRWNAVQVAADIDPSVQCTKSLVDFPASELLLVLQNGTAGMGRGWTLHVAGEQAVYDVLVK